MKNKYYNDGYDCYIEINKFNGIDIRYHGVIMPQYLVWKHPYPVVYIPGHGEASVHQLVAYAVYGVRQRNQVVNHKDNNPFNSHPSNLEYITQSENMKQALTQQHRTEFALSLWEDIWRATTLTV